ARLTGDGRVIYAEWTIGGYAGDARHFAGMRVVDLRGERGQLITSTESPARMTAVTATRDIYYYVTDTERVGIVDGDTSYAVEPLPRKVLQAVYIDGERDLLVAASWGELALCGLVDGRLAPLSHHQSDEFGDVAWVALGGPWLVAVVTLLNGAT